MIQEEWKDITNHEGRYLVSDLGRIASLESRWGKRKEPKILKPRKGGSSKFPYYYVALFVGKRKRLEFSVHRIVAKAFCENPEGKLQVNHKDGNPENNIATNLEWVTHTENIRHSLINGLKKTDLSENQVFAIRELLKLKTISQPRIAAIFGVDPTTICQINTGKIYQWVGKDYHHVERDDK